MKEETKNNEEREFWYSNTVQTWGYNEAEAEKSSPKKEGREMQNTAGLDPLVSSPKIRIM